MIIRLNANIDRFAQRLALFLDWYSMNILSEDCIVINRINFNIKMKKIRSDRSTPIPVSLSSKRVSLAEEHISSSYTPYKMDWKTTPLQTVDSNSSKAFFQNMKAELSTIKNDFQKLIRKDMASKSDKQDQQKSCSVTAKNKCTSVYKKQQKKTTDWYPLNQNFEKPSHKQSILNLQKNLPCLNDDNLKQLLAKTEQLKHSYNKTIPTRTISTPFDQVQFTDKDLLISQQSARLPARKQQKQIQKSKQLELTKLKEDLIQLQSQFQSSKDQSKQKSTEIEKLTQQNQHLQKKLQQISIQLKNKTQSLSQHHSQIQSLTAELQKSASTNQQTYQIQQQFSKQRNFYTSKINELAFHNQQLASVNMQFAQQNDMLKQELFGLHSFIQDFQRRTNDSETDCKRKIQYLQRDLGEYQKREDMFSRQIDKLNAELRQKHQQSHPQPIANSIDEDQPLNSNLQQLQEQILCLKDEIIHLKNQVQIQKQIHRSLSQKYEEQTNNLRIEQLSHQFQDKLNRLVQENGRLKNKINLAESNVESLTEQNKSYLEQISIYEERERSIASNRKLHPSEWEEMTDTIEQLRTQNKRLVDEIQFAATKQDVQKGDSPMNALSSGQNDSLLQLASSQLAQNQQLKDNIRQLASTIKSYEEQLQTVQSSNSRLQEQLYLSKTGVAATGCSQTQSLQNQLYAQIQLKREQLKKLKSLLRKVLVQKTNKREQQSEIQYFLREIDTRLAKIYQK